MTESSTASYSAAAATASGEKALAQSFARFTATLYDSLRRLFEAVWQCNGSLGHKLALSDHIAQLLTPTQKVAYEKWRSDKIRQGTQEKSRTPNTNGGRVQLPLASPHSIIPHANSWGGWSNGILTSTPIQTQRRSKSNDRAESRDRLDNYTRRSNAQVSPFFDDARPPRSPRPYSVVDDGDDLTVYPTDSSSVSQFFLTDMSLDASPMNNTNDIGEESRRESKRSNYRDDKRGSKHKSSSRGRRHRSSHSSHSSLRHIRFKNASVISLVCSSMMDAGKQIILEVELSNSDTGDILRRLAMGENDYGKMISAISLKGKTLAGRVNCYVTSFSMGKAPMLHPKSSQSSKSEKSEPLNAMPGDVFLYIGKKYVRVCIYARKAHTKNPSCLAGHVRQLPPLAFNKDKHRLEAISINKALPNSDNH